MPIDWEKADWLENFEQYNALVKECAGLADVLNLDGEARNAIRQQFAVGEPQRFQPVDWDAVKAYLQAEIAKLPLTARLGTCPHEGCTYPARYRWMGQVSCLSHVSIHAKAGQIIDIVTGKPLAGDKRSNEELIRAGYVCQVLDCTTETDGVQFCESGCGLYLCTEHRSLSFHTYEIKQ